MTARKKTAKKKNNKTTAKKRKSSSRKNKSTSAGKQEKASSQQEEITGFHILPISKIVRNPNQPRRELDKSKDEDGKTPLQELAQSIKEQGLLEPLVVTPRGKKFMIAAGERRWRACKSIKLKQVPCIVRPELSDKELTELGIVENIQREDLTPIDEANAYKFLIDNCGYTQRTLGKRVGRTMAAINYKLSLLKLSPKLKKSVAKGEITATQGRSIVQSVNKVKDNKKKTEVLDDIKKKIDQAKKDNGSKKLDTKDVKIIASQTTGKAAGSKSGSKPKTKKSSTVKKDFVSGLNSIYNTVEKLHLTNGSANACAKLAVGDKTAETRITTTTKAFNRLNDALVKIKKEKKLAGKK